MSGPVRHRERHLDTQDWYRVNRRWPSSDLIAAVLLLGLGTALMLPVRQHLDILSLSLIYLVMVVAVALIARRWVSVGAAIVAFLLFDFFFIPPFHTFTVARSSHVLTLLVFLGAATLTSQLVFLIRQRTREALERGQRMEMLYTLSRALIGNATLQPMLQAIVEQVAAVIGAGACAILLPDSEGNPSLGAGVGSLPDLTDRTEASYVTWAIEHNAVSGTGPLRGRIVPPSKVLERRLAPKPEVLYVPISIRSHVLGVLRVAEPAGGTFSADDRQLLATFANQAALAIERVRLSEEATRAAVLERSDQLKSALLSAVSHDLRTPLASIKASVTSLLQRDIHWSAEDQTDLLEAIDEETDRLTRIVNNLLDLSRIEAGVLRPARSWYDVEELLLDTAERARSSLAGHPISMDIEPKLPLLHVDYVQIGQVLMNLLENAAKYSPPGSEISVSARRIDDTIELAVADRGRGIPPGEERRVFEKFYRLNDRSSIPGAGIGLSICKGLVEAHGGRIWAEQRPGGGTIIRVMLPIEDHAVHAAESRQVAD